MAYDAAYGRGGAEFDVEDYDLRGALPPEVAGNPNFVPDVVRTFVSFLYRHIRERNVYEIHQLCDSSFIKLSERLFPNRPWPSVQAIAPIVDGDHVFCLLYGELYYRHIYARMQPTLQERCESWENYCALFQVVLEDDVNMQLPNQWLWDMVDEFVYQWQSFCQFRAKPRSRMEEEISLLKQCDNVWNVYGVLNYLLALQSKSNIVQILDDELEGDAVFTATEGYDYQGGSNVLRLLGYFSTIGLQRVHCLLGDYQTALQRLAPIEIGRPQVFQRHVSCQISVMYHYGFATLMQRRYVDAIKAFNQILLTIFKQKQFFESLPCFDQILKKNEQMFALLAICLSFCPQGKLLEENVNGQLREKYGDKILRMQRGEEAVFDELFSFACPKFVTPSPPNFDEELVNYNQDAYKLQLKLFLEEVRQQQLLGFVRSFLSLYSSISLSRLAALVEVPEATLKLALLTYKHKFQVVDADGAAASNEDIHFYIDNDMVHVVEKKVTRQFGDYFTRHILKFDEITVELENVKLD